MFRKSKKGIVLAIAIALIVNNLLLESVSAAVVGAESPHPASGTAAQIPGQIAGKVSAAIPDESVQHVGQNTETALQLADAVNWEDVVKTLQYGRVRIELLDGSLLNVGARSVMRVTKHDPESQQTELELMSGKLRAQVAKVTKPGGSFQVRTPTAVLGVVGTDFVVTVENGETKLLVLEGQVAIASLNLALGAAAARTLVRTGQKVSVMQGQAPSAVQAASPAEMQSEAAQTSAGPSSSPSTGPKAPSSLSNAATGASHAGALAGLGAAAAGLVGVAAAVGQLNKQQQKTCSPAQAQSAIQQHQQLCAADITSVACANADPQAVQALESFCSCLGKKAVADSQFDIHDYLLGLVGQPSSSYCQ